MQTKLGTLWQEALRLENPQTYTVNLSDKLTKLKTDLIMAEIEKEKEI